MPYSSANEKFFTKRLRDLIKFPMSLIAPTLPIWDWRKAASVASVALTVSRNLVRHHLFRRNNLHPLYVVWYVTLRCNLACEFCDNGMGEKYPEVVYPELKTDEELRVLELIRESCRSIFFTGGEPFVRKDFAILLKRSREIGFWPIFVNTNLSLPTLPEKAIRNIDVLIVSLGSTDESKYDQIIHRPPGQTRLILENLKRCARWQADGGPRIVINCVISSHRVADARSVFNFCQDQGFWFSPVPENRGAYVDAQLLGRSDYERLTEQILAAKKDGKRIYGSLRGLETLLQARCFQCYPTLAPCVYPNGDIFYPCHPLRQKAANILEKESFKEAWRLGYESFSPMPPCDNRCHLPCYVNNNQWMEHPLEMVLENFRVARQGAPMLRVASQKE